MVNYKLLSLAVAIINANKQFNAALSGSLMLALRGIDLGRDQHDLDITIDKKVDSVYSSIRLPKVYTRQSSKYPVVTSFYANGYPTIDIFYSLEKREIIHGIPCTTIEQVLKAKRIIANNSLIHSDARTKHKNDIKIIEESIINPPPMFYPSISDLISSEPLTSEEILSELREVNPYPLHITIGKRCPICDGRGFVHSDFYDRINLSQDSSKTNLTTTCRTCNGRGII